MVAQMTLDHFVWVRVLVPEPFFYGAMVKRLRRRPLKAKSRVRFPLSAPRRSKLYIACSDFSHTKVRTRSDRCSSFPNRTHFVGLRFVLETLFAGGIYHISMLHGSRLAIVAGLLFLFLNWKCSGLLISLIFAFRCQSGLQCGRSLFFYRMLLRFLYHVSASFLRQNPHR